MTNGVWQRVACIHFRTAVNSLSSPKKWASASTVSIPSCFLKMSEVILETAGRVRYSIRLIDSPQTAACDSAVQNKDDKEEKEEAATSYVMAH